jgi:hypothetical protein
MAYTLFERSPQVLLTRRNQIVKAFAPDAALSLTKINNAFEKNTYGGTM